MEPIVRASIIVRVSPERAFDVFSDADLMSRFWFSRRDGGLSEGERVTWSMGDAPDAPTFEVEVTRLERPRRLEMRWGEAPNATTVAWVFEDRGPDRTLVTITERGFDLEGDALMARLLDSTGGFNQVIVAAKMLAETGATVNVVADHA